MNLRLEEHTTQHGIKIHKLINTDNNEELKGIINLNLFVDAASSLPQLTLETVGDFEFEGDCHLVIKKVS